MTDEYFGSADTVALARRSASLWRLLHDNPRFAYYGRLVALSDPREDAADELAAMAKLQGAAVAYFYPARAATSLFDQLAQRGLAADRHEHYRGGESALAASERVSRSVRVPDDLDVEAIDARTPHGVVRDVAALWEACGVMPVPGACMRGTRVRGVCLMARDRQGAPVATASSFMLHHPASPHAREAFFGMLATREDRRGQRIALSLGARAMIHMRERHGARAFMTGVRADNASSHAVCSRLGVTASEWIYASCIDTTLFGASTITK